MNDNVIGELIKCPNCNGHLNNLYGHIYNKRTFCTNFCGVSMFIYSDLRFDLRFELNEVAVSLIPGLSNISVLSKEIYNDLFFDERKFITISPENLNKYFLILKDTMNNLHLV